MSGSCGGWRTRWLGKYDPVSRLFRYHQTPALTSTFSSEIYCHPFYADSMEGYGVDITAPRPPFVLFKVLHRYFRNSFLYHLLRPIYILFSLLSRATASLVGYLVGFLFGGGDGEGSGRTTQPVQPPLRARRPMIPKAKPSWGAPGMSMMDDEIL